MKSFKQFLDYIAEGGVTQVVSTQRELNADLQITDNINELNRTLAQVTSGDFANPSSALMRVSKTLSTYGIVLPQVNRFKEPSGEEVFKVEQWGRHPGYNRSNTGITSYQQSESAGEKLYVYFNYEINENGVYDAFAMVVDDEGLSSIMGEDFEDDGEELEEGDHGKSYWKKARAEEDELTNKADTGLKRHAAIIKPDKTDYKAAAKEARRKAIYNRK